MSLGAVRVATRYYLSYNYPFSIYSHKTIDMLDGFATELEAKAGQLRKQIKYFESHLEENKGLSKEKYLNRRKKAKKALPSLRDELLDMSKKYPHIFI